MMMAGFFTVLFGGNMAVKVRVHNLLTHELKKQIADAAAHLTRERIIALQSGDAPQNDEELQYRRLYEAMQARGLAGACRPAPAAPAALPARRQQQHPMYSIERLGQPGPIRVPSLYGNY